MIASWSLFANNFVMILIEVLSKEIGLKPDTLVGPSTFGIKVM
jgi:hypothetical protein